MDNDTAVVVACALGLFGLLGVVAIAYFASREPKPEAREENVVLVQPLDEGWLIIENPEPGLVLKRKGTRFVTV